MTRIELSRVSKAYPERPPILDGIDLQVADGEFVVLVGPNGSGKSTLLRMIAGLEPVSAGEIRMDGEIVNHWSPRRRQVALMFQSGVLYPHLTVAANLRMTPAEAGPDSTTEGRSKWGRRIGGWWSRIRSRWTNRSHSVGPRSQVSGGKQPSRDDRVRETARRLGIVSLLDRYPRQLSGGERQRVALGRALVRQPAVFLLDEPFANADSDLRREMRGVFRDRDGQSLGTTILVTHDHAEALAWGQRVVVLGNGSIQQSGMVDEVFRQPANEFVARFFGTGSLSLVKGTVRREGEGICFASPFGARWWFGGSRHRDWPTEATPVSLGWRPAAAVASVVGSPVAESTLAERLGPEPIGAGTRSSGRAGAEGGFRWTGTVRRLEFGESGWLVAVALERPWRGAAEGQDGTVGDRQEGLCEQGVDRENRRHPAECQAEMTVFARVDSSPCPQVGQRVWVEVEGDRCWWFDSRTGKNWISQSSGRP